MPGAGICVTEGYVFTVNFTFTNVRWDFVTVSPHIIDLSTSASLCQCAFSLYRIALSFRNVIPSYEELKPQVTKVSLQGKNI
jgi:hypothetical protein